VILYSLQPAMGTPNGSRLGAQIMALKYTKMEIFVFVLQLFGVVTTDKNIGQPKLAAWILPTALLTTNRNCHELNVKIKCKCYPRPALSG
jgi:hypothetical protein